MVLSAGRLPRGSLRQLYPRSSRQIIFFYRLLINIIEFYFPLFYYCLMTSAGGMLHICPCMGKLPPAELEYFRGFVIWKLRIFYHRLLGIPKDDKIVYNSLFGKLKFLLHLGFPLPICPAKYPSLSLRSWYFAGQIGLGIYDMIQNTDISRVAYVLYVYPDFILRVGKNMIWYRYIEGSIRVPRLYTKGKEEYNMIQIHRG